MTSERAECDVESNVMGAQEVHAAMQPTETHGTEARLRLHRLAEGGVDTRAAFAADVVHGLTSEPKRLPPKYFYDELGSHLFEAICLLPEYYLTRAEDEILSRRAAEIAAACGDESIRLVEFGSGSSTKTRHLIDALLGRQDELLYLPIDISPSALEAAAKTLLETYPRLSVEAYAGDYDAALARLERDQPLRGTRTLVLFLGSNIGNFEPDEARRFLGKVRGTLRAGDALLVGADLKKDAATLEAAYDDALGVTAAFNLNLLARINRELGADFDPRAFRHVAVYNERAGRVEMHLESTRAQDVQIAALALEVRFAAGERIHTENSHKYAPAELDALAARAGFSRAGAWLDARGRFSSTLFCAVGESEQPCAE
ncbi:MAG: L-histidine N(alpha)-methyltransferase [Pyrinomonadaceae bacterium]